MNMKYFTSAMNDSTAKTTATAFGALALVAAKTILEMEIRKHYSKKKSKAADENARVMDEFVENLDVRFDVPTEEQIIVGETEQD